MVLKRVVKAHDNLRMCGPFELLYAISGDWFRDTNAHLISAVLDAYQVRYGVALVTALPFPINIIAAGPSGQEHSGRCRRPVQGCLGVS